MNEHANGDKVNMVELLDVIKRYKWLLLALPFVAAVLAALLVFMVLRPTWEGSVILEIGHIGQVGQAGQTAQVPIEPVMNVVTRMMHPSFAQSVLNLADVKPAELKETHALYRGSLKVSQVKGTELLEVKLQGYSPEMVKNLINASVVNLQKVHSEMMAVSIDRYKKQLQILSQDIQDANREAALLRKKLLADHNWNAFDANLAANVMQAKSAELREMIQRKMLLEEQVSPSRTYTTKVEGDIYVSENPTSPKKLLTIVMAMLFGLLGAVFIAFAHNAINTSVFRAGS